VLSKLTISLLLILATFQAFSQTPLFAISVGGTTEDHAHRTTVDKNGNIIVVGRFTGTADFDPGAGVFNLTSNGSSDLFVAKYTSTGTFIWAFSAGGTDRDAGYGVATDNLNNIYITGYFRNSADFDPGAGTATLTSNGQSGFDVGWSGEIFIAKYSENGNYIWAFSVGGPTISDDGQEIIVDNSGNVVVTGFFSGTNVDFDPSPTSSFTLSSSTEEMFLAKYTSAGGFVWAKQMGGTTPDNETVRQLVVDNADNIYTTGFFTGAADFDPGPGTAQLTATSIHEGFIASYSSAGNYSWAYQFGGSGFNQGWSIDVDALNGAVYIAGTVQGSSLRFTSSSGITPVAAPGNTDAFVAKYSLTGNLVFVKMLAGSSNEEAYDISVSPSSNCFYVTGYFDGVTDFDPGTQFANLISNGGQDVFVGKYLLDGSYAWAFKIGSPANDFGFAVRAVGSDVIVNGSFMGTNVDFDPTANTLNRSSAGNYDGFVARYTDKMDCNNWLNLTSRPSYFNIGDLDVPGTQITVEATINRTAPYSGGYQWAGDVVSKHNDPNDANYLLRPNNAEITTSNGYFTTPQICEIELNKTYHVAMTYDGATLKFYRNGYLMSQVPATGNLFQNNHATRVGYYDAIVQNTQFIGYINEVRIWNVVRTEDQIKSYMNASLPPSGQTGLLAYYTFDNLLNKQGNATWNGTLSPAGASINQANPTCTQFIPDNCAAPALKLDFTYKQNVCNPLQVQFFGVGSNLQNPYWDFDGGNTSTGNMQPVYTFSSFGTKTIKFAAQSGLQKDTITKTIDVNVVNDPAIILTPDTTICQGATKQLRTAPALSFCWTPATYLNDPNSPNPITSTPQDITYYFTAEVTGNNLIANGNFSAGNTGFTSDYRLASPNVTEGEYTVGANAQAWNQSMSNCGDHTSGNGNMMIVNGSPVANAVVWRQTINITSNTNYAFSTWIQSVHAANPAQLQFSINGQALGNLITAGAPCSWQQFYTTWNSGNNTTATISIVNKNTTIAGNDFALDDISFAPVFIKQDSVKITVEKPVITANNDTSFCSGLAVQLNAAGAASYTWQPATGLSNASIANPVASPVSTTKYYVTGTTSTGCTARDSVTLTVNPKPTITKTSDTSVCPNATAQLYASGGTTYAWSPAATLSNPNIPNPIASPTGLTVYTVQVTDGNNCTNKDSVKVSIRLKPTFTVSANKAICEGKSTTLTATGGDQYTWSPAAFLSNASAASPVASPNVSTQFSVYAKESVCGYDSTMSVDVTVNSNPDITVSKTNDIDCSNAYANLTANGAATYSWFPVTGLDNPVASTVAVRANTTITYTVTGTNQFGCTASDTITVKVSNAGNPIFQVPNAFTPNGDRVNDCFGLRKWARVNELEFIIYNRWGQKVFSTSDPGTCWDGTLNGKPQDSGGFVYVIKAKSACGEVFRKGVIMLVR
jgi:gliding motility-associated-like protein